MTKVIIAPLKPAGRAEIRKKRVRGPDGKITTLLTVDADSPTLADDITEVFKRNVARARRANASVASKVRAAKKS